MNYTRIFEVADFQNQRFPREKAIHSKSKTAWKSISTKELLNTSRQFGIALLKQGLNRGDNVAILIENGSTDYIIIDFALMQAGLVLVPIHTTAQDEEIKYIIEHAEVKACIIENRKLFDKIKKLTDVKIPVFGIKEFPGAIYWKALLTKNTVREETVFDKHKSDIKETDLASIIYTSGSTGKPKGVMLTHRNIVSNIKSIAGVVPIKYKHRVASFLPLSHIFEKTVIYTYIALGSEIFFIEPGVKLLDCVSKIKPHYITSVPRILEKIYEGIHKNLSEQGGYKKWILHWALKRGVKQQHNVWLKPFHYIKLKIAYFLIYRRWRTLLGGELKGIVVGAAALQPKLGILYSRAGVKIREGYGMTETSPAISINRFDPGGNKFGTVGIPLPGVELKIDVKNNTKEGEILVKGPNVMLGYYKDEELTSASFTKDGWFKTGDVGYWVNKRFLKISDRKKNIFKTSSGKYIAPQIIEQHLLKNQYIDQCLVIGFHRAHVAALLVPNFYQLQKWCERNEVHWTAPQYIVLNPEVVKFYQHEIDKINQVLKKHECILKFHLLFEEWSPQTGEYTPSYKMRRSEIGKKFKKQIDKMYKF